MRWAEVAHLDVLTGVALVAEFLSEEGLYGMFESVIVGCEVGAVGLFAQQCGDVVVGIGLECTFRCHFFEPSVNVVADFDGACKCVCCTPCAVGDSVPLFGVVGTTGSEEGFSVEAVETDVSEPSGDF